MAVAAIEWCTSCPPLSASTAPGQRQVEEARVDRRAHAHLGQLGAGDLLHRHDVVGVVGLGDQRPQLGQIDLHPLVVGGPVVGRQVLPVALALLDAQPLARVLVGREHGRCGSQLGDHVGDRPALGDRQVGGAGAGELEHLVLAPRNAEAAQQLEDDVLGLHPRPSQRVLQVHLDHSRAGDLEGVAGHRHRHVQAAGADRDHPQRARRGRVRVGPHHDLTWLGEALQRHVVRDPVARARVVDPVLARDRLQHAVVVGVLEVQLDHVVVDVLHRPVHPNPRDAELLELHAGHRAGGVLEQGLVDAQGDRLARRQLALHQVLGQDLAGGVLGHLPITLPVARTGHVPSPARHRPGRGPPPSPTAGRPPRARRWPPAPRSLRPARGRGSRRGDSR